MQKHRRARACVPRLPGVRPSAFVRACARAGARYPPATSRPSPTASATHTAPSRPPPPARAGRSRCLRRSPTATAGPAASCGPRGQRLRARGEAPGVAATRPRPRSPSRRPTRAPGRVRACVCACVRASARACVCAYVCVRVCAHAGAGRADDAGQHRHRRPGRSRAGGRAGAAIPALHGARRAQWRILAGASRSMTKDMQGNGQDYDGFRAQESRRQSEAKQERARRGTPRGKPHACLFVCACLRACLFVCACLRVCLLFVGLFGCVFICCCVFVCLRRSVALAHHVVRVAHYRRVVRRLHERGGHAQRRPHRVDHRLQRPLAA